MSFRDFLIETDPYWLDGARTLGLIDDDSDGPVSGCTCEDCAEETT